MLNKKKPGVCAVALFKR